MRDAEHYKALVDGSMAGRKWILCADVGVVFTDWIKRMREQGLPRPLVLCGVAGTGDMPAEDDAEVVILGTSGETMLGGIRAYHDALRHLPDWAMDRIAAWDPDGEAWVLPSFLDTAVHIGGRRNFGARRPEWIALEDKMIVDEIWDEAGVDRAVVEIVPARGEDMLAATRAVAGPEGSVWVADNREGWNGGAEYVRYVRDPHDAATTVDFMEAHADRVRVMPFLDGVPASIHGMVFPDVVATFRPVEMLVYRQPGKDTFRYSGAATSWDPPAEVREEMRAAARAVGEHLRERADFRGAFTIDGIVTPGGFLPTELNARHGAGLGPVAAGSGIPMLGITRLLIEGQSLDEIDAAELEQLVVTAADDSRGLGGMAIVPGPQLENAKTRAQWDGERVEIVDGEREGNATLMRGPSAMGTMFRFSVDTEAVPKGVQAAPIVAQAFRAFDELWDAGIGAVIPGELKT